MVLLAEVKYKSTINMQGGAKVTGLPDPTVDGDAVRKKYVDDKTANMAETNVANTFTAKQTMPGLVISNGGGTAPTSSSDTTGDVGEIRYDNDYLYIKVSAGWKRVALSSF